MIDIGFVNGLTEEIENCMTEETIMPMSCKCILDRMVFKGAMTKAERDKIVRNLKTQDEGSKTMGKLIDVNAFKARISAGLVYQGADVLEALDEQPAIEERRWIPVTERLPEESYDSIIGWDAQRERCVFVQFYNNQFQISGSNETFDIKAWMPLPKPYEEGVEE